MTTLLVGCAHGKVEKQNSITTENEYKLRVAEKVQKNWRYKISKDLDGEPSAALVLIRVGNSGELVESRFYRKSNDQGLNKSAMEAIKKSAPFRGFPDHFSQDEIEIGIRFAPGQINRN